MRPGLYHPRRRRCPIGCAGRGDQRWRNADARLSLQLEGITEIRPGNYIYFDRTQVALGAATWKDCALTVLAQGREPAGGRPADPRLRQQDAFE